MKPPPFIITAAILFWGAHTGMIPVALAMALPLELPRLVQRRWNFDDADFNRVADICAVVIIGLFVYFLSITPIKALYAVGKWLPVAVFPIMAVQSYSTQGRVRASSLIWMLRRAEARGEITPRYVDLSYPYIAICVIAAGIANVRTPWFYPGVIVLSVWALFPLRSRRYPFAVWIIILTFIGFTGFGLHNGMHGFQKLAMRWYYKNFMSPADPFFATTAIGDIGELKPSGRILFRVKQAGAEPLPAMLIEGVYNLYVSRDWVAMGADLNSIDPENSTNKWVLTAGADLKAAATIAAPLKRGEGILKLPPDTIEVTNLPVAAIHQNRLGAVTVDGGPGLVTYTAKTGILKTVSAPDRYDLKIPHQEKTVIRDVARSLAFEGQSPDKIVARLSNWFQEAFTYSLELEAHKKGTALTDFLLRTRSGHCEYFATATVLLLREAGIPARYVTGYVVPERAEDPTGWVPVRGRHAHAWATAFINQKWVPVDTTPPGWIQAEDENAAVWEPLYSRLSGFYFAYNLWRWGEERNLSNYLLWLLIPMILYLGRSLFRRRVTHKNQTAKTQKRMEAIWPGTDSAFYRVEQALLSRGYDRFEGETLTAWILRIQAHLPDRELTDHIKTLLALHYKYRFDPIGLNPDEKERLVRDADQILSGMASKTI